MADNPFAVPEVAPARKTPAARARGLRTADPASRFGARVVDNVLLAATLIPSLVAYVALGAPDAEAGPLPTLAAMAPSAVVLPAFVAWQWYRQSIDGTTVGKRMSDIRIVTRAGAPPGFVAGVLLRVWVLGFVGLLGTLGKVVGFVDALMVFSDDEGRTLHDRLAGTRVVRDATSRVPPDLTKDDFDLD